MGGGMERPCLAACSVGSLHKEFLTLPLPKSCAPPTLPLQQNKHVKYGSTSPVSQRVDFLRTKTKVCIQAMGTLYWLHQRVGQPEDSIHPLERRGPRLALDLSPPFQPVNRDRICSRQAVADYSLWKLLC